jgi:hypothetical protein
MDKVRLLELAGIPLSEVTRRGFLGGLASGAAVGAAAGAQRSKSLEAVRQWFVTLYDDEGDGEGEIIGPFDSQQKAQVFAEKIEEKMSQIFGMYVEVNVTDGIDPDDFVAYVDDEIEQWKKYEQEYKNQRAQNKTIRT